MDQEPRSRVIDTHISNVVLVDGYAFKRKRPVRTAFLDFSTPFLRERACRREVELNRRLSPDVYLGVADVVLEGELLDRVVVMRRLPEDRRLSSLLDEDEAPDQIRRLARLIADFHGRARRGPDVDEASGRDAMVRLWGESTTQLGELGQGLIDHGEMELVGGLAREYLDGRRPLLDRRLADGRACDGHGDLQAGDVFCLPDGPRVLDCLEFADRFRCADGLADVAFMAMDLERLGHPDLGRLFLDTYRSLTGDDWPRSLEHHHIAYRAHVRAKVACLRSHQGSADAAIEARELHSLALRHLEAGRVRLVMVGGAPGTGKSTLAAALAERIGAVVLSSDEVRDEVEPRGGTPIEPAFGEGRYRSDRVDHVYDEMLRRAEFLLGQGEHVVLDASWLDADRRRVARALAARSCSHLTELRCTCPPRTAEERIVERARRGVDRSEVTVDLARSLVASAPPWPEAHDVETTIPVADAASVADVLVHRA
jgi:aminoglycoside phosphotransferase family enzyme/predicted kinase